jgi:hypothetical protein
MTRSAATAFTATTGDERPRRYQYSAAAHSARSSKPHLAVESVARLLAAGEPVYFTLQEYIRVLERGNPAHAEQRRILTFNTGDFTRYDIEAIHPLSLLS